MSRRERHIRELAAELGISITLNRSPRFARAEVSVDGVARPGGVVVVWGWDGRSQLGYFVALHELGHHAHRHPQWNNAEYLRRYASRVVEAEAEAWDWALEHAAEPPGAEVTRLIRTYWLGSYVRERGMDTAGRVYASVASRLAGAGHAATEEVLVAGVVGSQQQGGHEHGDGEHDDAGRDEPHDLNLLWMPPRRPGRGATSFVNLSSFSTSASVRSARRSGRSGSKNITRTRAPVPSGISAPDTSDLRTVSRAI